MKVTGAVLVIGGLLVVEGWRQRRAARFVELLRELPIVLHAMTELPDLIAWRLEQWVVQVNDLRLSPPVRDAWDGRSIR